MKFLTYTTVLLAAVFALSSCSKEEQSLTAQIETLKNKNRSGTDPAILESFQNGIDAVEKSGVTKQAKNVGDQAPDFSLPNHKGETVTLTEQLKKGPVVLTWYRGGWCPYCNLQLASYQKILPQLEEMGAQLVAVSPELPDKSATTADKNKLRFTVLTDKKLKVAKQYGIVFKLIPEVGKIYQGFFDINEYNGADAAADELPLAATYVIGKAGKITYAFLESDYTKRAEPEEILAKVAALK